MENNNSIYCRKCEKYTHLTPRANYSKSEFNKYWIGECNSCDFCFLINNCWENERWNRKIYPNTLPEPIDSNVPDFLKKDLLEANTCFANSCYKAAALISRRILQMCCLDKKAPSKEDLLKQIDWLLKKQIITAELQQWAHQVRIVGNEAAHEQEKNLKEAVTKEDAEDIKKLLKAIIELLYITPEISKRMQEKRKKTQKAKTENNKD